jgi:hypothetical protein
MAVEKMAVMAATATAIAAGTTNNQLKAVVQENGGCGSGGGNGGGNGNGDGDSCKDNNASNNDGNDNGSGKSGGGGSSGDGGGDGCSSPLGNLPSVNNATIV